MDEYESLSHTTWDCKYHVVFIPKCRRKTLYQELRRHLGEVFRRLALQKESKVEEGHLMPDHVHMLLSIPPKYAVSQVAGFIKGKSAIHMARVYGRAQTQFRGTAFLGPGILRQHGRARRRSHPRVHPQSRERRSEAGADEPLALTSRPWAAPNSRGRVSDPFCRFERLQS
jgi:putative transposase